MIWAEGQREIIQFLSPALKSFCSFKKSLKGNCEELLVDTVLPICTKIRLMAITLKLDINLTRTQETLF
jgi:hypothetical protein